MGANTFILNNTHVVGNNNNTYTFNFPSGNFFVKEGSEICISQMTIPYSWFNITSALGNNALTVAWKVGAGTAFPPFTIPDGFYTVETLNNWLKQRLIAQGMYLIDAAGKYVFYTEFVTDPLTKKVSVNTYPVPVSLPTGYTQPSNFVGYPNVATNPYIYMYIQNVSFANWLGFNFTTSTYSIGNGTTATTTLSTQTPQPLSVTAVAVRCSLAENNISSPTDLIDILPVATANFGSNINYVPNFEKWVKIKAGTYSSLTVTLTDQNNNMLLAQDPNLMISLLVRDAK